MQTRTHECIEGLISAIQNLSKAIENELSTRRPDPELNQIAEHIADYWSSIEDGVFINGLIDAMRILARRTDNPRLKDQIEFHEKAQGK